MKKLKKNIVAAFVLASVSSLAWASEPAPVATTTEDYTAGYFRSGTSGAELNKAEYLAMPTAKTPVAINKTISVDNTTSPWETPVSVMRAGEKARIKAGSYIGIESSVLGTTETTAMTVTKSEVDIYGEKNDNAWKFENIYGLGGSIIGIFDPDAGKLTFPAGQIINEKYKIQFAALRIATDGKITVRKSAPIVCAVAEDGTVTLPAWGIVSIDPETNSPTAYGLMTESTWHPANATVKGTSQAKKADVTYPCYVEQNKAGEVMFYGLTSYGDVLASRPMPDKTLSMSPQWVTANAYGDFFIYYVDFTTGKINTTRSLTVTPDANGFKMTGWAIGLHTVDSSTQLLDAMQNVTIETSVKVTYPDTPVLNFNGSGTQASPWEISTAKDLLTLSALTESGNSFSGKYFVLKNDIDLSALEPGVYVPVGNNEHRFNGSFDGRGFTLIGLKLEGRGYAHIGIFGYLDKNAVVRNLKVRSLGVQSSGNFTGGICGMNEGLIENCEVTNSQLFTQGAMTGGITGGSLGTISGCYFSGNIRGIGSQGGILGQGNGTIKNCHVQGNIRIEGYFTTKGRDAGGIAGTFSNGTMTDCFVTGAITDTYGRGAIGGLIGRTTGGARIYRSFNVATVAGKRLNSDVSAYVGGLTGLMYKCEYHDCYNAGTVMVNDALDQVGGLTGDLGVTYTTSGSVTNMTDISVIENCFNSGQVISASQPARVGIYGTTNTYLDHFPGHPEDYCFKNCFYDSQVNTFSDEKYGRDSKFFKGVLPAGFSSDIWMATTDGYPVLKVHAANQYSRLSSAMPILKDGQTASKVKGTFALATPADVTWAIMDGDDASGFVSENSSLAISGNTATVKDQYGNPLLTARSGNWGMKVYRLAVVPKWFDGEGTAEEPYLLKNVQDFVKLNTAIATYRQSHKGDYFAMTNDVDFKLGDEFKGFGFGTNLGAMFAGSFDGRNHYIHGLKIDAGYKADAGDDKGVAGYCGLFNCIGPEGIVKNLRMASDCQLNFYVYSGVFVAFNRGRVENCRNYASVTAFQRQNGGITGINFGEESRVINCYNAGRINSFHSQAGGITGINDGGALIDACQNDGEIICEAYPTAVSGATYKYIGGIAGFNTGSITNCLNQGNVEGLESTGGIAGYSSNPSGASTSVIKGNLVTGLVVNRKSVKERGAVLGNIYTAKTVEGNVFDSSVNLYGAANNTLPTGFTALSSSELVSGQPIEGLDAKLFDFTAGSYPALKAFADEPFSKTLRTMYIAFKKGQLRTNINGEVALSPAKGLKWQLEKSDNFTLEGTTLKAVKPVKPELALATLRVSSGECFRSYDLGSVPDILKGEGTAESPYLIEGKDDWIKLADFVASSKWEYDGYNFSITKDIDFAQPTETNPGDSLRILAHSGVKFSGVLEGNGHTVKGFKYFNPNGFDNKLEGPNLYVGKNLGLIGAVGLNGVVRNLNVAGEMKTRGYSGGIVGDLYGKIENCTYSGKLSTEFGGMIAGIVYNAYEGAEVTKCVNTGTIAPDGTMMGGIAVYVQAGAKVTGCENRGKFQPAGTSAQAGGIAGAVYGTVKDSRNIADQTSYNLMGGIAYVLGADGTIDNCYNTGNFLKSETSTGSNIAGIVGDAKNGRGSITNCYNSGNLEGTSNVAGLALELGKGMTMTDCHNTGNLLSKGFAAGAVLRTYGESTNYDNSEGVGTVIERCYNTGDIVAASYMTAGLVGQGDEFTVIRDCYNLGDVTVDYESTGGLTTAGIVAESHGLVDRCFNTGNITSNCSGTGGITGSHGTVGTRTLPTVQNCFNLGDIAFTGNGGNTYHGRAGGISGSTYNSEALYINCYNAGNVTGASRIGGIVGQVFSTKARVEKCYNSGRVMTSSGNELSYTVYAKSDELESGKTTEPFYKNFSEVYYDRNVNAARAAREVPGSAKTSQELKNIDLGDAFTASAHGGYPALKAYGADNRAAALSTAMLGLFKPEEEHHGAIYNRFALIAPDDAVWSASDASMLKIEAGYATPLKAGNVRLECALPSGAVKSFLLTLDPSKSSVEDAFAGKEVKSVSYIDLTGRETLTPEPGQVYIVRTVFTDGSLKVEKMLVRE